MLINVFSHIENVDFKKEDCTWKKYEYDSQKKQWK